MHNSTERGTAAAALAGLFYTSDSTAAHSRRDETKTQGPGPLRRPKGASSPIKKMAAMPYGQQEVKTHSPRSPVSPQSHRPQMPNLSVTRAAAPFGFLYEVVSGPSAWDTASGEWRRYP